jgi:RecG-like helicase
MALAVHGDLDISVIREKPANRQDVTTAAVPDTRIDEVMAAVARAVDRGERAFWICPAVDSEDAGDASADRSAAMYSRASSTRPSNSSTAACLAKIATQPSTSFAQARPVSSSPPP